MKAVKRVFLGGVVAGFALCSGAVSYLSPECMAVAPDGKTMYVTAATAAKLLLFDAAAGNVAGEWPLPCNPSGVAVAADGTVYVTGGGCDGVLLKLGAKGNVLDRKSVV